MITRTTSGHHCRIRIPACQPVALALFLLFAHLASAQQSVHTLERTVTKIADGVYVIIHKDVSDDWPQGNTVVIIGDRGVFVVDACLLTRSAKEDIAEIRRLTSKPVRYLLNTHWHIDHNGGNHAYMDAFPAVEIIAHTNTRAIMNAVNPGVALGWSAPDGSLAKEIARLKKSLETGNGDDGKPLSATEKGKLPQEIADRENQMADYKIFKYQPPTLVFSSDLTLDFGNREIQVKHLGKGNTPGDALVYLPHDRILITGDLLVSPVPYMRGSFPNEWRETLSEMVAMDADIIVPGHGAIQHDKTYMTEVLALLDSVLKQVREQAPNAKKLEDLHIDIESFRKRMVGDDPENNTWWKDLVDPAIIERALQEARGGL